MRSTSDNVDRHRASVRDVFKVKKDQSDASVHGFGTPVMVIELLGCRPHWTIPLCEMGISSRSVYQMTPSREQARAECNCETATERGKETCESLGDVTNKPIDRFAVETVRTRIRNLLAMKVPRRQAIRHARVVKVLGTGRRRLKVALVGRMLG